jgi:response regulator RpfG family c-di-GMP phosphodiesterase
MSLKILLISDNDKAMQADRIYLKDRGLHVHTCLFTGIINDLVAEVKPDIIFINPTEPDNQSTEIYHSFLNDIRHLDVPVIYTLSEDDVYLVSKKRTAAKSKRNIIADNMIDAIKLGLTRTQHAEISLPTSRKYHMPLNRQAYRA